MPNKAKFQIAGMVAAVVAVVVEVVVEVEGAVVVQAVVIVTISVSKLRPWSAFKNHRDGTTKGVQNK